jgi:hypothetical protein
MNTTSIPGDRSDLDVLPLALGRVQWHHYVAEFDHPPSAETLDGIGHRGWRLAAIVPYNGLLIYTFTRPT